MNTVIHRHQNPLPGLVAAFALCLVGSAIQGAPSGPTVEARGIRIVGPGYTGDTLRPFNWSQGTTVALLIQVPGGGLIGFDQKASTIELFRDDGEKDLTKKRPGAFSFQRGYDRGEISKDGKACLVEVGSPDLPSRGARSIHLKGTLVLQSATGKKSYRQEGVEARRGEKILAGPIPFRITRVGKPEWSFGDEKFSITLEARQDITGVASIRFLDGSGMEIKTSQGGFRTTSSFGSTTATRIFNFQEEVGEFTVEVTYWTDVREVKIPYSLKIGVGMQG
jgi:hypothetical protein